MTAFPVFILSSAAFSADLLDSWSVTYTSREAPLTASAQLTFSRVQDGHLPGADLDVDLTRVRLQDLLLDLDLDRQRD